MSKPRLNLIGPGRLGRSLARLWQEAGCLELQGLAGRSRQGMEDALTFIGAGTPVEVDALPVAELWLLATPDDALPALVAQLIRNPALGPGSVVFHCSGALASSVLAPLSATGAFVASIHPIKSFANPALSIADFTGTRCAYEGNQEALAILLPLFAAIGAQCFAVDGERKTLYHAGPVLACNALVVLMEAALISMEAAGVPRDQAWPALRPLIDGTLNNIDRLGTAAALTGPVARGDAGTVARQLAATTELDTSLGDVYRSLSRLALTLAQPQLTPEQAAALAQLLRPPTGDN